MFQLLLLLGVALPEIVAKTEHAEDAAADVVVAARDLDADVLVMMTPALWELDQTMIMTVVVVAAAAQSFWSDAIQKDSQNLVFEDVVKSLPPFQILLLKGNQKKMVM